MALPWSKTWALRPQVFFSLSCPNLEPLGVHVLTVKAQPRKKTWAKLPISYDDLAFCKMWLLTQHHLLLVAMEGKGLQLWIDYAAQHPVLQPPALSEAEMGTNLALSTKKKRIEINKGQKVGVLWGGDCLFALFLTSLPSTSIPKYNKAPDPSFPQPLAL